MADGRRGRASSLVAFSIDKSTFSIEADLGLTNQVQSGLDNLNWAGLSKQQLQGRAPGVRQGTCQSHGRQGQQGQDTLPG
jgi:hypothetical protein